MSAENFLATAAETLADRGRQYDQLNGERSGVAAATAFTAITGKAITAEMRLGCWRLVMRQSQDGE